jgi:type III restriction enzyme
MKLKFKKQQFQTDAVNAVVDCFAGQPNEQSFFTLDRGCIQTAWCKRKQFYLLEKGFKNRPIDLSPQDVLANIATIQLKNGLKPSSSLAGEYNLTVEMETGTGKTYVYIKTMLPLLLINTSIIIL